MSPEPPDDLPSTPWVASIIEPDGDLGLIVGTTSGTRSHAALADWLRNQPYCYYVLGEFAGSRRTNDSWTSAHGIVLDLDWSDPGECDSHLPLPPTIWPLIAAAGDVGLLPPGMVHATRRGLRWLVLLKDPAEDADTYRSLVQGFGETVLRALGRAGVPLWRDGVVGISLDEASLRVNQMMAAPIDEHPIVVTGVSLVSSAVFHSTDETPRLDPRDVLPPVCARYVMEVAESVQIAPEVVMSAILTRASAIIGSSTRISYGGRSQSLGIHVITSAYSGSGKSTVRRELRSVTARMEARFKQDKARAAVARSEYESRLKSWSEADKERTRAARRSRAPENPGDVDVSVAEGAPEPPKEITATPNMRWTIASATMEGLVDALVASPRGVLLDADEAHLVFGSMGRYDASRRSTDAAALRTLMEGAPYSCALSRSNAHGDRSLPRPFLAMDCDVQPAILRGVFEAEDGPSGLTARLFVHEPPSLQGSRKYAGPATVVSEPSREAVAILFEQLYCIPLDEKDNLPWASLLLHLSPDAEDVYVHALERLERAYAGADPDEEWGVLGHTRGRILQVAAILELLENPRSPEACGPGMDHYLTAQAMRRAVRLVDYFLESWRRLLGTVSSKRAAEHADAVDSWGRERLKSSKPVTVRELERWQRRYRGDGGRARAVRDLRAAGWTPEPADKTRAAGRPGLPQWLPPGANRRGGHEKPADKTRETPEQRPKRRRDGTFGNNAGFVGTTPVSPIIETANRALAAAHGVDRWPRSGGTCPACGHHDCWGHLGENPSRWICYSGSHGADSGGCGRQSDGGYWTGDVLDLELNARGVPTDGQTRLRIAREVTGMASASQTAPPPPAAEDDGMEDVA